MPFPRFFATGFLDCKAGISKHKVLAVKNLFTR